MRHLKLVEDESQQMAYDDQTLAYSQFRDGLERCGIYTCTHTCIYMYIVQYMYIMYINY